jgi:hypothetical protein
MRKLSATILFAVFVLAVQGYAQSITGSLNGRVVDQQGSAVPDAKVTATEPTKKVTVATNSTGVGDFSIAGLAPGNYSVTVEAAGFKKLTQLPPTSDEWCSFSEPDRLQGPLVSADEIVNPKNSD